MAKYKTMKDTDFVSMAIKAAKDYKTLYVMGCFGAPMNAKNKKRYTKNTAYNRKASRTKMIMAASDDTFGFDCVCLIKGILWGWNGNKNKTYGGAVYPTKAMVKEGYCPDFGTEGMKDYCTTWSKNFKDIQVGEVLYMKGHAGIYMGGGLAVESTPAWKNRVQITAVANIGKVAGYKSRKWTAHGKLRYIEYTKQPEPYFVDDNYKVLVSKILRKSMSLTNSNKVRVKECDAETKKNITSKKPNDIAKLKVGTTIPLKNEVEKDGRVWMQYGKYYIVVQNVDGTKQVTKV